MSEKILTPISEAYALVAQAINDDDEREYLVKALAAFKGVCDNQDEPEGLIDCVVVCLREALIVSSAEEWESMRHHLAVKILEYLADHGADYDKLHGELMKRNPTVYYGWPEGSVEAADSGACLRRRSASASRMNLA